MVSNFVIYTDGELAPGWGAREIIQTSCPWRAMEREREKMMGLLRGFWKGSPLGCFFRPSNPVRLLATAPIPRSNEPPPPPAVTFAFARGAYLGNLLLIAVSGR